MIKSEWQNSSGKTDISAPCASTVVIAHIFPKLKIIPAIITGRISTIVEQRAKERWMQLIISVITTVVVVLYANLLTASLVSTVVISQS